MLDSGAGCSVLDIDTVQRLGYNTNSLTPYKDFMDDLTDASGNKMNIIGSIVIPVTLNNNENQSYNGLRF